LTLPTEILNNFGEYKISFNGTWSTSYDAKMELVNYEQNNSDADTIIDNTNKVYIYKNANIKEGIFIPSVSGVY
jgi:hypothetical protein